MNRANLYVCRASVLVLFVSGLLVAAGLEGSSTLRVTPAPAGPYRVEGNRILDAHGRPYLIRGTELPTLTLNVSGVAEDASQFGPFSGTAFITIRQRLNMNAVRLPVNAREYEENSRYQGRVKEVVRKANQFELLAILSAAEDTVNRLDDDSAISFWAHCAAEFKDNSNVFFALSPGLKYPAIDALVHAIRRSGAAQPVIAAGFHDDGLLQGRTPEFPTQDPNIIYEASPRYATTRTDQDRWTQFGLLSEGVPVLANGLDPELDRNSAECAAFPRDPAEATRLVEDNLTYFDTHFISWTISSLRPGRMTTDYRYFNWLKLDDGWTCGESPSRSGIAMVLMAHLWSADPHGLFAVNQTTGGFLMARGSVSTAYGPILADREVDGGKPPYPTILGNISIRVTDSRGVARLAPLLHTGGGWSQVTFVVPANSALGPAEVAVVRSDGTESVGKVIITAVAAGLWTAPQDGRGPVIGEVSQRFSDGRTTGFPAWECSTKGCRTIPIPLSARVSTTVRLEGTGFRYASPKAVIRVTIDDVPAPVLSFGPTPGAGRDQLTIKLPDRLRGHGEADLVVTVDGALSNVVRINCGAL